ncbi:hypothetical protein CspeluHIS016_0104280 [Cutaneotrichosporon spelunceum]|uniref:Glycosyl transferase CAP10 domain-containing protein n=1 Tax=Cutaneotrichosporon spelunceum TaxID=1672016 RepID=A0AAD3Y9I4_9TREE|nr:hypothetical protein CspeluHIS016_0104280 [Cutaneotrichosporon spelunceum]
MLSITQRSLPQPGSMSVPRKIRRPRKILYVFVVLGLLYWFGIRHHLGKEMEDPLPLGFAPEHGHRRRPRTMTFARNGMATLNPLRRGAPQPEHPFYELMERGEETWRLVRDRQSKSVEHAAREYKRRYGINPPDGFDKWFAWAKDHGVELVDEYDLMMRDILAHHAMEPAAFIARSLGLASSEKFTYQINITRDGVKLSGERGDAGRPKKLAELINSFRSALPPNLNLALTGSDHDVSGVILGKDQRKRAKELVSSGQHFMPEELRHYENPRRTTAWGWFKACPLDSPANMLSGVEAGETTEKAFIHDHVATMDFCEFPNLKRLHGALQVDREDRSPSMLKPWLVHSKLPGDASFLLPPLEGFTNLTDKAIADIGKWEHKVDPRVHWRGGTTGGLATGADWHDQHRYRLHLMFNGRKGNDSDWEETVFNVMLPDGRGGYTRSNRHGAQLARALGDVKLSGDIIGCPNDELCKEIKSEIETFPALPSKSTWMFRYMLDVDGNGWSERFHRLLSSASPVIKMTIFADWHMDRLIPWYHYIPIQADYSDLYDVLAFFVGPVREDGTVDHERGHDYLGKKIGQAGQDFTLQHWRWADMQAYMYRLLLELHRLHQLDRDGASYRPTPDS